MPPASNWLELDATLRESYDTLLPFELGQIHGYAGALQRREERPMSSDNIGLSGFQMLSQRRIVMDAIELEAVTERAANNRVAQPPKIQPAHTLTESTPLGRFDRVVEIESVDEECDSHIKQNPRGRGLGGPKGRSHLGMIGA